MHLMEYAGLQNDLNCDKGGRMVNGDASSMTRDIDRGTE